MNKSIVKTAMLIDDDRIYNLLTTKMLKSNWFAEKTLDFTSAHDALGYIDSCNGNEELLPEIIFLDINMPVMNGFEFLNEFSKRDESLVGRTTIFMISSTDSEEEKAEAINNKLVKQFFDKPLSREKLAVIQNEYSKINLLNN